MNHPLYIAPDEEIISVIARLRTIPEADVTLVFPKHSVVTQSIINLKLLAREGEKLQKNLTLVSQNENARSLAEKIGFATLPYTQEMERGSVYVQGEPTASVPGAPSSLSGNEKNVPGSSAPDESVTPKPKSTEIGSQGFYHAPVPTAGDPRNLGDIRKDQMEAETIRIQPLPHQEPPVPAATTLRVRNMSPDRPPSLNSLRTENVRANDISHQSMVTTPIFPDHHQATPPPYQGQTSNTVPPTSEPPTAIRDFFSRSTAAAGTESVRMPDRPVPQVPTSEFIKKEAVAKKVPAVMVGSTVSSKLTAVLGALVVLLIVATGAIGFFLVFPSATVTISPQTITDSYDQSFTVDANTGSQEVPLEKNTEELTVNVAGIASGAASTSTESGSRAKGKLKITNTYGSDPQTLVATTRFESSSGKIYRIQQSISVPGNGSVEADVIADGSGESYNLSEGTLTIPGLKGSDKYEKITASVVSALSGGGGNEALSSGTFIRADEETLRQRAAEEAKRVFSENINNEEGNTFTFTDGLQVERVTETNMPKVGSVPGEYEYSAVFKVTAYTTSKEKVTEAVIQNIRSEYDGITFVPTKKELSFADFTLTENGSKASLKVHLEVVLSAEVNASSIKTDLAGKSAEELTNFTTAHPEVKSLDIIFNPPWAIKRIPKNPDKIELVTG